MLNALDGAPSISPRLLRGEATDDANSGSEEEPGTSKVFVASVSPQVRASIAATYGIGEQEAGWMIGQLLSGPSGLRSGGKYGNGFTWVMDTNTMREACLVIGVDEMMESTGKADQNEMADIGGAASRKPKRPILTSACPGWICYAEKTHPHILPHLSRLKSPQALTGMLLKTVLSKKLAISPDRIWHVALMPCFDKKLEASRAELTDSYWQNEPDAGQGIRDVDCVITARELLMLADTRGISFPNLPRTPLPSYTHIPFPDPKLDTFLFPQHHHLNGRRPPRNTPSAAGTSGGYLYHILKTYQVSHPGSQIRSSRGRNPDVVEYTLVRSHTDNDDGEDGEVLFKAARYYGFRNIQNLVRKLKPPRPSRMPGARARGGKPTAVPIGGGGGGGGGASRKPSQPKVTTAAAASSGSEYAYVEVMACPGGCTNGGGQIKIDDLAHVQGLVPVANAERPGAAESKAWLAKVDEAYFSAEEEDDGTPHSDGDSEMGSDVVDGISRSYIKGMMAHWSDVTGLEIERLVYTSYRRVDSDVGIGNGNGNAGETDRVVTEIAGKIGGGW